MAEITINPDKNFVKKMRSAIAENGGYCPCSVMQNEDTRCICKEFFEQDRDGPCQCGLYYKKVE